MSATFDLDTAVMTFATGGTHATVMRFHNDDWQARGADLCFLSCFPRERESLFPPLTSLSCRPGTDPPAQTVTTVSGVTFSVIDVETRQLT